MNHLFLAVLLTSMGVTTIAQTELAAVGATAPTTPLSYAPMQTVGRLLDPRIDESSGLAASRLHPGEYWTHNDSGGSALLYRFAEDGRVTATVRLDIPRPTDWEDLASFEMNGKPLLLVGDVGDNGAKREFITLWLLAEPDGAGDRTHVKLPATRIDLRYPDGPHDCESVAVDPTTGEVLLITKIDPRRDFRAQAAVYTFDLKQALRRIKSADGGDVAPFVIERAGELSLKITTAADLSPDGRRLVVATYGDAWQYVRPDGETWAEFFADTTQTTGTVVRLGPRGQSEAIAFDAEGRALLMTAEGVGKSVWKVSPVE